MLRFITTGLLALTLFAGPAQAAEGNQVAERFASSFAHEAKGEIDEALNDVLVILRGDQKHYVATLRAGWLYYVGGRYADSVQMYEAAEALAPRALEPRLGLMLPLMAAKRWAKAEIVGRELLKLAPRDYTVRSRLAWIAFSQGRYKEAEELYAAVLADYPSDLEMMLGLAWTWLREGRKAEARGMFEQVLSIRSDNMQAKTGLQSL
ncbi:MAG: tetratricopeptide repeat protein [Deltaproteobacteria bacterium]|nr:MAG: tetratricopeptide repeat protein [Deltaproteobacteria bacterium]